jgi:HflK protein
MDLLLSYLGTVFTLLAESAPYLLVGFAAAGMIRILIPGDRVYRHLGRDGFRSVALASLFGVPLPLCSCSVLPTATALRKSGASRGATTSFLISTPETGVDSISITWALIDPFMTVIRPIAALLTALVTGSLVNRFVSSGGEDPDPPATCGDGCCAEEKPARPRGVRAVLRDSVTWAFGPLLDDLTQWLVLGFLLSGVVAVAVPDGFFTETVPSGWIAAALMVVLATPMYICATAATPLAATLIAKGLDPGAALVLLLVGPATNVATMLVVRRVLGTRVLVVYLAGVVGCALGLGAFVSDWYAGSGISLAVDPEAWAGEGLSFVSVLGAIVLIVLLARSARRTGMLGGWAARIRAACAPLGFDPTGLAGRIVAIVLLAGLWLSTAFGTVGPGETGWVVRFGRVVRTVTEPGLVVHWPEPIERLEVLRSDQVRGVDLGAPAGPDASATATAKVEAEAEVLTGDENLLRIAWAVHFRAGDPFAYRFRVEDPPGLVRAFAGSALRTVVARRSAAYLLVGHRPEIEAETLAILAERLREIGAGIEVVAVRLVDVHAAREVHDAFRDVASALEDKERSIREAEGERSVALADGEGEAFATVERAESDAEAARKEARGRAAAFLARLAAYMESPDVARIRLSLEKAEETLAKVRAVLLLGADVDVDLWNTEGRPVPLFEGDREK